MKTKQRLTMIETDYKHIESSLDKLFNKLDNHEDKVDNRFRAIEKLIYIGFGILATVQILVSSGMIKIGGQWFKK